MYKNRYIETIVLSIYYCIRVPQGSILEPLFFYVCVNDNFYVTLISFKKESDGFKYSSRSSDAFKYILLLYIQL